jgi:DNA-binding CsgD family transcriptional regulator
MRKDTETRLLLEKQKAEQEIVKLQNENLQSEISHKNIQLANSTMALIRKNELLIGIKQELEKQKTPGNNGSPGRQNEKLVSQINKNIEDDQDWKIFEELFDQAHGDFFKRLKSAYPELTQSDLKLCAYLKLNLSSKEIAPLLNISYRGVETRRYRLRKRLLLDNDANLVEFILQF